MIYSICLSCSSTFGVACGCGNIYFWPHPLYHSVYVQMLPSFLLVCEYNDVDVSTCSGTMVSCSGSQNTSNVSTRRSCSVALTSSTLTAVPPVTPLWSATRQAPSTWTVSTPPWQPYQAPYWESSLSTYWEGKLC